MTDIEKIKAQLQIAIQALEFYANPENYGQGESFAEQSRIVDVDLEYTSANRGFDIVGGKLARRALLEIEDLNGSQRLLRDRENLAKK
jgi:hypothetical protein